MFEKPVLVFTRAAAVIDAVNQEKSRDRTCVISKGIMDVRPGQILYITIGNFGKADLNPPTNQKASAVANELWGIVHINHKCFLYRFGSRATTFNRYFITAYYKPTLDRFEQMVDHEAFKEKDEVSLPEDRHQCVHLSASFAGYCQALLGMLMEFKTPRGV